MSRSNTSGAPKLSVGQSAALACLIEATAPKPGNVHRGADFAEMSYPDFCASALAISPAIDAAANGLRVGAAILQAIQATRALVGKNTNLGTVLLIAPLAAVPGEASLASGVRDVLAALNAEDCRDVYAAIRLAQPGGMGRVDEADLAAPPPDDLLAAMRLAADRDLVAKQYVDGFHLVLNEAAPMILAGVERDWNLLEAVVHAQLRLMSAYPDSLIARKCSAEVARQAADHADTVLALGSPGEVAYEDGLADLDFWLRSDGYQRNPGTTADLLAAGLFALLRDGKLKPPLELVQKRE
ncbi:MAG: triphosphoribosyl-dephospho-CoA synthase [Planctomycetia bacterium]|nr:triphosphoribosyl-dephospho-CoA synthase [Planctomycetia bacterium]